MLLILGIGLVGFAIWYYKIKTPHVITNVTTPVNPNPQPVVVSAATINTNIASLKADSMAKAKALQATITEKNYTDVILQLHSLGYDIDKNGILFENH